MLLFVAKAGDESVDVCGVAAGTRVATGGGTVEGIDGSILSVVQGICPIRTVGLGPDGLSFALFDGGGESQTSKCAALFRCDARRPAGRRGAGLGGRCAGVRSRFLAALLLFCNMGLCPMDPNQGMHPLIIPDATNQMGNALRSERSFTAGAFGSESKSGFWERRKLV